MNYRLSIASVRGLVQKHGYVIEVQGRTIESQISSNKSSNLKVDLLFVLERGLRAMRQYVKHDDILYIEIPNQHLANWLDGRVEYKKYSKELDAVFDILESLDCKYKILCVKESYALKMVKNGNTLIKEGYSLLDSFKDLK